MDNFSTPTTADVRDALRRTSTLQLRRVFYGGLQNPRWVKPLDDAQAFASPPEPIARDGYVHDLIWPEIDYLVRVAPLAPTEVVDVLEKLVESTNVWVRSGTFSIGLAVPPMESVRIAKIVDKWEPPNFGWRTDPIEMATFTARVISTDPKIGKRLANKLFRPLRGEDGQVRAQLDDYWYERGLPSVTDALGHDALAVVTPWLEEQGRLEGSWGEGHDSSGIGRGSIRESAHAIPRTGDVLVDTVRDLAIDGFARSPTRTLNIVDRSKTHLARRITLYSAAQAIRRTHDGQIPNPGLVEIATTLLGDPGSLNTACWSEYVELASAYSLVATSEDKHPIIAVIEGGPAPREELIKRFSRPGQTHPQLESVVDEWLERWRHDLLVSIGDDALPTTLRDQLRHLRSRRTNLETTSPSQASPDFLVHRSPTTQAELQAMDPPQLVNYLETWQASAEWMAPSHRAQAMELEAVIAANPACIAGQENLVATLRATYLRAIVGGWLSALKEGLDLDFHQLTATITDILDHDVSPGIAPRGDEFDDDPDFIAVKDAAIDLAGALVARSSSDVVPHDTVERIAPLLICTANDKGTWREYYKYSDSWDGDALTLSLNTRWTKSLSGLVALLCRGRDTPWYQESLEGLSSALDFDDPAGAAHAVVGRNVGNLIHYTPDFAVAIQPRFFGDAGSLTRNQQIALSTAISIHHFHPDLHGILGPPMVLAIGSTEPIVAGWKTDTSAEQRIGEWVIAGIARGHVDADDPVREAFYAKASPEVRGNAIGHIAWTLMHTDDVESKIRRRLECLWDERVEHVRNSSNDAAELGKFYWFVRSEKFDAAWWLPRLLEAATLYPKMDTRGLIGDQLAAACYNHPRLALDALTVLLRNSDDQADSYDLVTNAAPSIIAVSLESSDMRIRGDGHLLMDHLGANGQIHLSERVEEIRKEMRRREDGPS